MDCLCEGIADAGVNMAICQGDSLQLNGSGGVSYEWTPSATLTDPTIADPLAFPSEMTTYTLTVTDENGCTDTAEITIDVNDSVLSSAVEVSPDFCEDGSGEASVSITQGNGPFTITWQTSSGEEQGSAIMDDLGNYLITDLNGGTTYCIQVTDANGCVVLNP